jgi:DNA-binding transcriptional ArsR family regulator
MKESQALPALAALAQESRLRIVRRLVRAGPEGIPAGAIAEGIGASPSNVSFHLKELERADVIAARREARSIIYTANYKTLRGLIRFLMEDCCASRAEICAPLSAPRAGPAPVRKERADV